MSINTFEFLKDMQCWLLDMDGTIYLEDELIEGAFEFIQYLQHRQKRFLFITNNSSKSNIQYVEKLHKMGFSFIHEENILTSGQATIAYVQQYHAKKKVYLVGTKELEKEFVDGGIKLSDNPDVVVIGFDTSLTYEKLWKACDLVRNGFPYIATHPDINCPVQNGFMPDIGALIAFIQASTGRNPDVIIGKPHAPILQVIRKKYKLELNKMVMVGDRLYTDIAMQKEGIKTILTLSGETKLKDLESSPFQPDLVIKNVGELVGEF